MTEPQLNSPSIDPAPQPRITARVLGALFIPLLAFVISLIFTSLCRQAAGDTLGLFFGGVLGVMLLCPALTLAEKTLARQVLVPLAATAGAAIICLAPLVAGIIVFREWCLAAAMLLACSIAVFGLALLLERLHIPPSAAAALTVSVALAWLTWPIWLAPALAGQEHESTVAALVAAHPLFALNKILTRSYPLDWPAMPIAYHYLMNLNQSVSYSLPENPWPGIFGHVLIGGTLTALAAIRRPRPRPSADVAG